MDTELELELEETTETETQTKSRAGYQSPRNRKLTAEMVKNEPELAYQITISRVAEAFTTKESFIDFCNAAWDYKQNAVFHEFEVLLDGLNETQKEALINRLQKPKTTTRKKTVVTEE